MPISRYVRSEYNLSRRVLDPAMQLRSLPTVLVVFLYALHRYEANIKIQDYVHRRFLCQPIKVQIFDLSNCSFRRRVQ